MIKALTESEVNEFADRISIGEVYSNLELMKFSFYNSLVRHSGGLEQFEGNNQGQFRDFYIKNLAHEAKLEIILTNNYFYQYEFAVSVFTPPHLLSLMSIERAKENFSNQNYLRQYQFDKNIVNLAQLYIKVTNERVTNENYLHI